MIFIFDLWCTGRYQLYIIARWLFRDTLSTKFYNFFYDTMDNSTANPSITGAVPPFSNEVISQASELVSAIGQSNSGLLANANVFEATGQTPPLTGYQRFKRCIKNQLTSLGLLARPIGISALETTKEILDTILNLLAPVFVGTTTWIFDLVKRMVYSLADQLWAAAQQKLDRYRNTVCSAVATIFACLAISLPKNNISSYGRYFMYGLSFLIYYTKSYLAVGAGFGLVYMMSKFNPFIGIGIEVNNYAATPQGFKEDTTKVVLDLVSMSVLFSAATTGLSLPSDAKSWDELLKRHSLLHRSTIAWEFGINKVSEVIETVTRYILKYFYGREFTSFEHIGEVEKLYDDVIELTRLEVNVDIGRDIALTNRIEKMYAQYLNLLRVYSKNRDVCTRLQRIGAPLTEFYRRVADKNPKAHVMRKEPVCFALYGPTGIGKSYLMSRMQQDLLKIIGKFDPESPTDGLVYSRAIEQEFWDGYTGQPIAIFDDFGQKVDSPSTPNNEFFEVIRAVNIFPYQLHSAALQEKANNPFASDFVVLTTNLSNFKPQSIISSEAFTRRIHMNCSISLIPEVQTSGTNTPRLDIDRLRDYQALNNLPFYDLSHLIFTPVGGRAMSYEQFIVEISLIYKRHLEAFSRRQESNLITAHEPLPTGAFSVNPAFVQSARAQPVPQQEPEVVEYAEAFPPMEPTEGSSSSTSSGWPQPPQWPAPPPRDEDVPLINPLIVQENQPAEPQAIEDIVPNILSQPRMVLPNRFMMNGENFNRSFRSEVWERVTRAPEVVRRFVLSCWEDMEWFRQLSCIAFAEYYRIFRQHLIYAGMATAMAAVFHKVLWTEEKEYLKAPITTTLVRNIIAYHGIAITARDPIFFYPTLLGSVVGLTRTVVRDIIKHGIYHSYFDVNCHICKRHNSLIKHIKPHHESIDPVDLYTEFESLEPESSMKVPAKKAVTLEGEFQFAPKYIQSDNQESPESSMKVPTKKAVQLESQPSLLKSISKVHDLDEDITHESNMKVPPNRPVVQVESDPQQILINESQRKLDAVVALVESGRGADDSKKKRAAYEGIRCHQLEDLKSLTQRNTWLLSSYVNKVKHDVGFVTVIKGHKAVMNFHYFQILAKHFNGVPPEEMKLLFSSPHCEGGHEIMFHQLARTAKPLMRGLVQTEFYIITLPRTCNLGRDLTKHLIDPSKITNLVRGLPLQLCTYRKDNQGTWRSATIAGPLEKISTSDVSDVLEEGKTHRYLESVYYQAPTKGGDCGNPVFIDDDAFEKKLLGFHFAGLPGKGICSIVTAKDVQEFMKDEMCLSDPTNIDLKTGDDFPLTDTSFTYRV